MPKPSAVTEDLDLVDDAIALVALDSREVIRANHAFWDWTGAAHERRDLDSILGRDLVDALVDASKSDRERRIRGEARPASRRRFPIEFTIRAHRLEERSVHLIHARSAEALVAQELMLSSYSKIIEANNRKIKQQQRRTQELLDHMQQAIVTIGSSLKVGRTVSAHTHSLFEREELRGVPFFELIQLTEESDTETYSRARFVLENIFGEDAFQWSLVEHDLPRCVSFSPSDAAAGPREFEIDYAPIMTKGAITEIMIIVRDVTDFRALEESVRRAEDEKERSLQRVAEVATLDPGLFQTFLEESLDLLDECEESIARATTGRDPQEALSALFRAVHTLKGNARIFKIASVQDAAHDFETRFHTPGEGEPGASSPEDFAEMEGELAALRALVDEFGALGEFLAQRTGFSSAAAADRAATTRVTEKNILSLRREFKDLRRALRGSGASEAFEDAEARVGSAITALTRIPLSDLFARFDKTVHDLARESGVRIAPLHVTGGEIEIDSRLAERLRDVLLHALRNAVDHGLENPDERMILGKPVEGHVRVVCSWNDESKGLLAIEIGDDGRGIDLDAVEARALRQNLIPVLDAGAPRKEEELLELLFLPGFTTAERVTPLSGRGVGMDVIRARVRELRGDVSIESAAGEGTKLRFVIGTDYYERI